jgi:toxin ParE1/3/4
MQIRWSREAAAGLEGIVDYIREDNPDAALRIGKVIYARVTALGSSPYIGRSGRVEGTREFPLTPLPFVVIYRVLENAEAIEIVNVIHGAQRWPPIGL